MVPRLRSMCPVRIYFQHKMIINESFCIRLFESFCIRLIEYTCSAYVFRDREPTRFEIARHPGAAAPHIGPGRPVSTLEFDVPTLQKNIMFKKMRIMYIVYHLSFPEI